MRRRIALGWLLCGGALAAQERAPITGRVLDARGAPAAGAAVQVRWRVHPELPGLVGMTLGDRGLAERAVRTDADGRFRFTPPHAGPFLLVARAGAHSSVAAFPTMAGDHRRLRLEPDFRLGGRLLGADGEPVAGARVELVPHPQTWSRLACYRLPERRDATTTDADGRFALWFAHGYARTPLWAAFVSPWCELDGQTPGPPAVHRPIDSSRDLRLQLRATPRLRGRIVDEDGFPVAGASVRDPLLPGPGVISAEDGAIDLPAPITPVLAVRGVGKAPRDVTIARGDRAGIEIALRAGLALRASLRAADDAPLARARVLVAAGRDRGPPDEWLGRTDADGELRLSHLPPARHLRAFVEVAGTFVEFFAGELGADRSLGACHADPARTLRGRLLDAERAPLPATRVVLRAADAPADQNPRVTWTDRAGRFAFAAVKTGRLVVIAGGGAGGWVARTIAAELPTEPLELGLTAGLAIAGVVHDERGRPVAGAWLALVRAGGIGRDEIHAPTPGTTSISAVTDPEGRFRFRGLPEGDWQLICNWVRGGAAVGGGGAAVGGGATAVASGAGEVVLQTRIVAR